MSFLSTTLAHPQQAEPHSVTLDDGTHLAFLNTGLLRVSPPTPGGHRVLISCGIHGNETAPMEIVDQLFSEIRNGDLRVRNELLLVIGNPPAANAQERFIDENLNRLFSGKHAQSESQEAHRARKIEQVTADFFNAGDEPRLHYDLHTAIRASEIEKFAVYPFLHDRVWSQSQIGFLETCGIDAILLSNQPAGTYSYLTSNDFNADSFTVELGKVQKFGDNNMQNFTAMIDGLRRVIAGQEKFDNRPRDINVFRVIEEVIKRTDNFKLHIGADAKNFTRLEKGALLASDDGYEYRTQDDSERFVFPIINVPLGQRAMLIVAPTNLEQGNPQSDDSETN